MTSPQTNLASNHLCGKICCFSGCKHQDNLRQNASKQAHLASDHPSGEMTAEQLSQQEKKVLVAATTIVEPKFPMHYPPEIKRLTKLPKTEATTEQPSQRNLSNPRRRPNVGMRRLHCALETPWHSELGANWQRQLALNSYLKSQQRNYVPPNHWLCPNSIPSNIQKLLHSDSLTNVSIQKMHLNTTSRKPGQFKLKTQNLSYLEKSKRILHVQ